MAASKASYPLMRLSYPLMPPRGQTIFHSAAVTGCTERRLNFTRAMSLRRGSALTAASDTGLGIGFTAFMSAAAKTALGVGRVRVSLADDLRDAHDRALAARMIEEGLVTLLHGIEMDAGRVIAHTGPGLALGAAFDLLVPGKYLRLRLDQPVILTI